MSSGGLTLIHKERVEKLWQKPLLSLNLLQKLKL